MSLLLEALKKAALEKSRGKDTVGQDASATQAHTSNVSNDLSSLQENDSAQLQALTEQKSRNAPAPPNSPGGILKDGDDVDETDVDEPNVDEISIDEPKVIEADPDQSEVWEVSTEHEFDEEDLIEDWNLDHDEDAAEEDLEDQSEAESESENSARLESEIAAREQADVIALQQKEEEQRQQSAAARRAQEENRQREVHLEENKAALEHLLSSGKKIALRSKRRARFLYAMLLVTALGGILSYYFYLLANSNIDELRQGGIASTTGGESDFAEELNTTPRVGETTPRVGETTEPASLARVTPDQRPDEQFSESPIKPVQAESPSSRLPETAANTPTFRQDVPPVASDYLTRFTTFQPVNQRLQRVDAQSERVIVRHKPTEAQSSLLVQQAYDAFKRRDFVSAARDYSAVLKVSPQNRDAVLGAAAVATEQKRWADATRLYQNWLSGHPDDAYVRAAILSVAEQVGTGTAVVEEVRNLLLADPDSAHLHFLKGTQSAANGQWHQAQSDFFAAYYRDSGNPDYAYNLAVSLDHLKQTGEARRFYQQALELGRLQEARFSEAVLLKRLAELGKSTP